MRRASLRRSSRWACSGLRRRRASLSPGFEAAPPTARLDGRLRHLICGRLYRAPARPRRLMIAKTSDFRTGEEIQRLRGRSDLVGGLLVLHAFALIAGAMALFAW